MAVTIMNFPIGPLSTTLTRSASAGSTDTEDTMTSATMINQHIIDESTLSGCKRPLSNAITEVEEKPLLKKPRTAPKKKRVSFGTAYIHTVDRVSEAEAPKVWYSTQEIIHSRRCDRHWVNYNTHRDNTYRQELFKVLGAACGKIAPSTAPLVALADSQCRGLEREMTPCFRERKKQVISNVLQSQAALKAWKDVIKGDDVLAAHYHKLALPASRFARLLAEGDAMIIKGDT